MFKNWKTTSAGIIAIIGGICVIAFANHPMTTEAIMSAATSVVGGLGLIFAKDSNVTGGNVQQ